MLFAPQANDAITIGQTLYRFAEHPALPQGMGFPYGQEGRAATVYQLRDDAGNHQALKVFKFQYRKPALFSQAESLAPFVVLPGLLVCRRTVLTADHHTELVETFPALEYGALMPWIEGRTWLEIVQSRVPFVEEQSRKMAEAFLFLMAGLEERQVAHGDISGANLILCGRENALGTLQLVDVEQLYAPSLSRPAELLGGSPGYAHHRSDAGLWQADMDRFAGAIILAEMLGWCDPRVCKLAVGETYFAENELQQESERRTLLHQVLVEHWGNRVGDLFTRAWESDELAHCPTFSEWRGALQPDVESAVLPRSPVVEWEPIIPPFDAATLDSVDLSTETEAQPAEAPLQQPDQYSRSGLTLVIVILIIIVILAVVLASYYGLLPIRFQP